MNFPKNIERTLFEAAAGLADPVECAAFLDWTCQGNHALRERLEKLLAVTDRAEDFFDIPPVKIPTGVTRMAILEGEEGVPTGRASDLAGSGACIGRYKLLERIGEGGCGMVYRAEQLEPVRRMVALKIIRLGMDTEGVIARFELERQALAMMDHPNIARVLDAGATFTGRPFFVMELVEGERITDYCDKNRLDVRQRLELFVQICLAIQHAHHKGVMHRDIKPSNVLVRQHDGKPVPKVIDFGIAKAATDMGVEDATLTAFDQFVGTPASMSPEQAAGGVDVDTRTDIYSLGVLLYELLTGLPPFDPKQLRQAGVDEIRRILREDDPPKPSLALMSLLPAELKDTVACRSTDPHKLVSQVKGDLDWIVMKAMEKDRQRRYETPNGLAMDLRRHLENEPVTAGPPGRRYRFLKLVRRNKVIFGAVGIAVAGLLAGLGFSTRMYLWERAASAEQGRLRVVAEAARANEASLREAAEFRSMVGQAAVALSYGKVEEADRLLAAVPVERIPSSLEAAQVYRTVGDWHLLAGRLDEAARRYAGLASAIANVDSNDTDTVSRELLPGASALCFTGNFADYERLRQMAIERFASTTHPVVAEQVVKVCLLRPADEALLRRLKPLVKTIEAAVDADSGVLAESDHLKAWSCFSLALMGFRSGDDASAKRWARRCISYQPPNPARNAAGDLVLAMVEHRAGQQQVAEVLLTQAKTPVMEKTAGGIQLQPNDYLGRWHDWLTARALLEEAEDMMGR